MEGNSIVITAKQELAEAGGGRTRVFEQKFSMPTGVKAELVRSSLNKEGTLVITAPQGEHGRPAILHGDSGEQDGQGSGAEELGGHQR